MSLLSVNNVQEYRQKYADALEQKSIEIGKPITDEMLTKSIYKKLSSKKDGDGNALVDIDYYSFYKSFNPEGKYANLDTYRVSIDDSRF